MTQHLTWQLNRAKMLLMQARTFDMKSTFMLFLKSRLNSSEQRLQTLNSFRAILEIDISSLTSALFVFGPYGPMHIIFPGTIYLILFKLIYRFSQGQMRSSS